ncbi:hypothetical protein G6F70_009027 [Rhizopus microsporus]|nr:hypothetical protein G6F71_008977 [Rhizopus microsporus]KAG1193696.1 hypothetical protein G6F70_009027 [Rhizopus microsporus]
MSTQEGTEETTPVQEVASPSTSSQVSFLSSPQGSMASKHASHPTPMEEDSPVIVSSACSTVSNDTTEHMLESSLEVLRSLKEQAKVLFGKYIISSQADSGSPAAVSAHTEYENMEKRYHQAKLAHKSFVEMFSAEEEVKISKPGVNDSLSARLVVPQDLPALQLKGESVWRKRCESFDSAYDFCNTFENVLRAHGLALNSNWERLLPLCMNAEQVSWCREALVDKNLQWKQVRPMILNHFDTPYRKFLLMVELSDMKQDLHESNREYANRYQKLRREAGMQDNTHLAVMFFASLKPNVKSMMQVALSSHFGTTLPTSINQIVDLVLASGEDSLFSSKSPYKRARNSYVEVASRGINTSKVSSGTSKVSSSKSPSTLAHKRTLVNKPCMYCDKPWTKGHKCQEFLDAKNLGNISKTSRMAIRTVNEPNEEEHINGQLNRMALDCKSKKDKELIITRDFKGTNDNSITFPILVNNRKAMTILDTGANFSSVNKTYCLKNNISYFNVQNNDVIKLADSSSFIKRIGYTNLNIKCNGKSFTHKFELGIGFVGLPYKWSDDDTDSNDSNQDCKRIYNDFSELLTEADNELSDYENCLAGTADEYQKALDAIKPLVRLNQDIPKGSFCTIPESIVSIETPVDVTSFRRPYPVALKYHKIVQDQIDEWLENGVIKRAPANTEWNSALTVVKKNNAKGEITGYRVCHDPRHINALLKSIDRMPLPKISEIFEELKGASVYSTLDLKSAFNSLKLRDDHAHKLAFSWNSVQYVPIGTPFGLKHVSSVMQRTMSIVLENMPYAKCFVDDIVIASNSMEEHKLHVSRVINKLTEVNLKLNPDKCKFFQRKISLLGFRISPKGISLDLRKVANVKEFPVPQTGKDIMRYCGLINYFRPHIPKASTLLAPLDALRNLKSLTKVWNSKHQACFDNLKKALQENVLISYPDLNEPFYVATDASNVGVGVVLYQKIDGKIHYISMMAKGLSKSERNYSATKRELLAVVYALKKFHKYLWGNHFTLYTDHKALTYLHTQKIANAMLINWFDTLLQYDFKIVHLPGIDNILPDTLSRLYEIDEPVNELGGDKVRLLNRAASKLPSEDSGEYMTPPKEERKLILLREHLKGHFGSDAIYHALKRKGIYWSNLKEDAVELVKSCTPCQQFNIIKKGYNPLRPITAKLPGDSWGIDLAGPMKTSFSGNNYLLVMVDIATRYCVLKPLPDKQSMTIVKALIDVFSNYGFPRIIQSDNGGEFVNELMQLLAENAGYDHRLISSYHPRANGVSERWVQSAVKVIKKQIEGAKADWDLYVPSTQLFLNGKVNERTKTPPFTLMFGRNMNDFEDYSQEKDEANKEKINRELLANIKRLTEIVFPAIHERTQVITNKQKERFDASHKLITIPENSYVMVKVNLKTNKLDPDYQGPYKVKRITQGGSYVLEDEMGELLPKNYPPSALKLISQDEVISTDKFYQVEAILTHKKEKGKYLYKCRWKGYNKSDDTWEPATNFADPKFITEYWQRIGIIPEDIKKKYSMKFNKGKTIDNESAVNSKSGKRKMSLDLKGNSHSSTTYKGVNNGDNSNKRSKRH